MAQRKKFVLRAPSRLPETVILDEEASQKLSSTLRSAFSDILLKKAPEKSYDVLYNMAYSLVLNKRAQQLYDLMRCLVSAHVNLQVLPKVVDAVGDENFLSKFLCVWEDYYKATSRICEILMSVDRVEVARDDRVDENIDLALMLFREDVLDHPSVLDNLTRGLLNLVFRARKGEPIDLFDLKRGTHMLIIVGLRSQYYFEDYFEWIYLEETAEFYKGESLRLLEENTVVQYITMVPDLIELERERAERYLGKSSELKILGILREELVEKRMTVIMKKPRSGVADLLKNMVIAELNLLYKFFTEVDDGLKTLAEGISSYLRQERDAPYITGGQVTAVDFVENFMELRERYETYIQEAFFSDMKFRESIEGDLQHLININPSAADFLSAFIHVKMKKGFKTMCDADVDMMLEKCIAILRFVNDKEKFKQLYRQNLAKRILAKSYASVDIERAMMLKLKPECGSYFVSLLERMFRDMESSAAIMEEFKAMYGAKSPDGIEIVVSIITTCVWPTQTNSPDCVLPTAAFNAFNTFKVFYLQRYTRRQLIIQPQLGQATLSAIFYGIPDQQGVILKGGACVTPRVGNTLSILDSASQKSLSRPGIKDAKPNRKHLLQVSTFQMCILMLFNIRPVWTYKEIQDETKLSEEDLLRTLYSLCMSKLPQSVLTVSPNAEDIQPTTTFRVNDMFTYKSTRVSIPMASAHEVSLKKKVTPEYTPGNMKYKIEAAIVRILKAHGSMQHKVLVTALVKLFEGGFIPCQTDIDVALASLINRGFASCCPKDKKTYSYTP